MNVDICEVTQVDSKKVNRSMERVDSLPTETLSKLYKAFSDENRLKIVMSLMFETELCVCDIANIINATVATTSHHLQYLKKLEIIASRKEGKLVYYFVKNKAVCQLIQQGLDVTGGESHD